MITPALLILASPSLIATALVRLARVVDRIRKLAESANVSAAELDRHERRARFALTAVALFFCAVAVVVVAGFSIAVDGLNGGHAAWVPLGLTFLGMALIVAGAGMMVAESLASAAQIRDEIRALRPARDAAPR